MSVKGDPPFNPGGFGHVDCANSPGPWETFKIIPTAERDYVFNIESVQWEGVFLRMDASDLPHEKMPDGGGVVNCQRGAGKYPSFEDFHILRSPERFVAIESAYFPGFYLRMFGTGGGNDGFGVVNCQWGIDVNERLEIWSPGE